MKIVIISPYQYSLNRGIERFVYSLSNELAINNNKIIIYTWKNNNNVSWGNLNSNVKIRKVPYFRYFRDYIAPFFYRFWMLLDRPDTTILNFLYHGESQLPKTKSYIYVLNSPASQVPNRYDFIKNNVEKFKNIQFVGVSKMVVDEAIPFIRNKKISTIFNGVDINKFVNVENLPLTLGANCIKVITAAALEERKGMQFLIKALSTYKKNYIYHIYGAGPYKTELVNLINSLGLENNVKLMGVVNNMENILKEYDIFCLLSKGEAFALAPLEALSARLPVLVSKHKPFDELIQGNYGLQVDENNISEILDGIEQLIILKNDNMIDFEKSVEQYSWENIAKQYLKLINQ
jgi:glycosyltransferase involved in cell wall biosynthesis